MSESNPTPSGKPAKPSPDFPLFAHAAGVWAKKIRGKLYYFGPWSDPEGALKKYEEQKDDLLAGRKPREDTEGLTVKQLCNKFLNAKQAFVDQGRLSPRTWDCYERAAEAVVKTFGGSRLVSDLGPDDFARLQKRLAKRLGPNALVNAIQYVRSIFKWGFESGKIDRPVRFGPDFKRPSKRELRLHRAAQGKKLFTAEEIHKLLGAASVQVRAMILLGINCGFGNADVGNLPIRFVDLDAGVIDFPRPKTGVERRCILWPETIAALRDVLAKRKDSPNPSAVGLVFVTKYGKSWGRDDDPAAITKEFAKLLKQLGIDARKGLGFYTLRHTFRTVADEAKDQPATDYVMGHEAPHMSSHYHETISDARLRAVADHVRSWLFPPTQLQATE
jgi:integrase